MDKKGREIGSRLSGGEKRLLRNLETIIRDSRRRPGALIPILQATQRMFGYLPEPALKRISLQLGKSYSEVAGVAGFYSFFSMVPRGKHLVRVCMGTACYVRGAKEVLDALKKCLEIEVGETTPDGLFTLEIGRCFGACGLAPVIMIDEDVHQRVRSVGVEQILDEYRAGKHVSRRGAKRWGR